MSGDSQAFRVTGALPPPPGVTPNFVDPPSQDAVIIAVHAVLLALATLFVSMRGLLRAFVLRSFGWDDGKLVVQALQMTVVHSRLRTTSLLYTGLGKRRSRRARQIHVLMRLAQAFAVGFTGITLKSERLSVPIKESATDQVA